MAKNTENAVLVKDGKIAFVRKVVGADGKKTGEAYCPITGNKVEGAVIVNLKTVEDVHLFVEGFGQLPAKPRTGYDQYYNGNGPTNPRSPKSLTVQGLLKNIIVFTSNLHEMVAKGGAEGDEAKAALDLIQGYNSVAVGKIAQKERDTLLAKYIEKNFTAEEIEAARARSGGAVPAATVAVEDDEAEAEANQFEAVDAAADA